MNYRTFLHQVEIERLRHGFKGLRLIGEGLLASEEISENDWEHRYGGQVAEEEEDTWTKKIVRG